MKSIASRLSLIMAIAILMAFSTSCKKDNLTLLTDGTWKFKNMTTTSTDQTVKDLVAFAKAFMTDATIKFYEDGSYELNSPLLQDPEMGTWELIGETQLIMTTDEGPSTSSIDKLTKSEFNLIETWVNPGGGTYSTTTFWEK